MYQRAAFRCSHYNITLPITNTLEALPRHKHDAQSNIFSIRITITRGLRPVGRTAKLSETTLEAANGREINIQLSGSSSVGYPCSQHANCILTQNLRHLWHCAVWQNCTF
jgi:hypothetical protein